LRATALILQIKDDLIREILDRAATAARDALRDPSRRRVALRTFIREATAALGTERVTVYAAPTDAAEVREACAGLGIEADVRVDPSVEDGVRVASAESRAVVENTLASRMDRMRHGLAPKVAAILWSSTP
jgi:vacuolar-type H+-ATPase subunit E/Vma4